MCQIWTNTTVGFNILITKLKQCVKYRQTQPLGLKM